MTGQTRPLSEIMEQAIRVLSREMGITATVRFLNQFTTGYGNYTEGRVALLGEPTLEEILSAVREGSPQRNL